MQKISKKYQFEGKKKSPSPPGQTAKTRKNREEKTGFRKRKNFPTSFKSIISYVQNKQNGYKTPETLPLEGKSNSSFRPDWITEHGKLTKIVQKTPVWGEEKSLGQSG